MKITVFGVLTLILLIPTLVNAELEPAIIPKPTSLKRTTGEFVLPSAIVISSNSFEDSKYAVAFLKDKLEKNTASQVKTVLGDKKAGTINFLLVSTTENQLGDEGYSLTVHRKTIIIKANSAAGLFYGVQTLLQLFPKEIERGQKRLDFVWKLPCVEIRDSPRLGWRGLLFDVSRHFFTKDEVKQYIDGMVRYKYNVLHLHLSDNEGWRIEIKKYPKLTEIGAWRPKREGNFGTFDPPARDAANDYGGFYTQEDIRELVQYAKERFVNIMPEIDVPGHSLAAVAAYPELSCTADAKNYRVRSGEKIMDWSAGGELPEAIYDNNLCPANEQVYQFIDDVISEIAPLFPFHYIHMGGDETSTNYWEKSDGIKSLMQRENLKDMRAVQGYFIMRVNRLVQKHGKKFMGWDEILASEVPEDAAVMAWHTPEKGAEATQRKHPVVMTPFGYTYLDLRQADAIIEPPVYKELRLSKAYQFNPVPKGADINYILGGQANLWTEQVYNIRHAEYMTWPRAFAIAEALWSVDDTKNWPEFFRRVEAHFKRLDESSTKYAPSVYDPIFGVSRSTKGQVLVSLSTEIEELSIFFSFDNSYPDRFYPQYKEPIAIPGDAKMLRVITYKNGYPIGRMHNMPVEELLKRIRD